MAWCVVSDAVHDFFPLSMKGKVPAAPLLGSLVRLWAASLCKAGQTRSTSMLPRVGTDVRALKCTLMVAKGKPSVITSYITFPELVMFCFAKSVGSSGTHHFQLHSCNKQGHLFNFPSAFYWLIPGFTGVAPFSVSLSCLALHPPHRFKIHEHQL